MFCERLILTARETKRRYWEREQRLTTHATAVPQKSLFLERFWREFRPTSQCAKPAELKNGIGDLLMTFSFPFDILRMR